MGTATGNIPFRSKPCGFSRLGISHWAILIALSFAPAVCRAQDPHQVAETFRKTIRPILVQNCYACHGDGESKGGLAFDLLVTDDQILANKDRWYTALKFLRAGIMPPATETRPPADQLKTLDDWIKYGAIGIDPSDPDPGRVTIRRLSRIEYGNTIRDLMGIEFHGQEEFPVDDSGYGFDDIGDVLSISPLLMEKYLQAAQTIVTDAVPRTDRGPLEVRMNGEDFKGTGIPEYKPGRTLSFRPIIKDHGLTLSFSTAANVSHPFKAEFAGTYRINFKLLVKGDFGFNEATCRLALRAGGKEVWTRDFVWDNDKEFNLVAQTTLEAGDNNISFVLTPLDPGDGETEVSLRIVSAAVQGPLEEAHWGHPYNYDRFFFKDSPPTGADDRRAYAREILSRFTRKAFRRPPDDRTLNSLVKLAERTYSDPQFHFEEGVANAMIAALCSPRFLFRLEGKGPANAAEKYSMLDEYALASRLSYFLWSSMPDDELSNLADRGELRKNLTAQVKRMLADPKSSALSTIFATQWLPVRDIDISPLNAADVLKREGSTARVSVDRDLRRNMREETEMFFGAIVNEDLSILNLIDSDFSFLNAPLAQFYGITGVKGEELHRVTLPPGKHRGGVITQASVLTVTSDPTRTSPVKRGQFILDNFLGTPAPPPPPNVPQLEQAEQTVKGHLPTVREAMAIHRADPVCASCHARMDPLGLALENYDAIGLWRDVERGQKVDASGTLATGEKIGGVDDLKKLLLNDKRLDFYHCFTEKMMIYALGRGPDMQDLQSTDQIVDQLEKDGGRFSTLIMGIIDSTPFQKRRNTLAADAQAAASPGPGASAGPGDAQTK
jgi:hypothetical protein